MIKLLHFQGKGYGFMQGVTEYVVIKDDDAVPNKDHCAPGFKLTSCTELVADLPHTLPFNESLIVRG